MFISTVFFFSLVLGQVVGGGLPAFQELHIKMGLQGSSLVV